MSGVKWLDDPEAHDYAAAGDYLSLTMPAGRAREYVTALLQHHNWAEHPAKDVLRASGLPLLPVDNEHVAKDLRKIKEGEHLSPVLLVRGNHAAGVPLVIADGYHRVCAAYWHDENAVVRARIV